MNTISLDAAEVITGISRRTLWRRVGEGALASSEKDARGRTTLELDGVLSLVQENTGVVFNAEDADMLLQADAGNAEAQADIGAMLYVEGAREPALYWLHVAAEQGNADAMQWLGTAYAASGSEQDNSLAIMWIAKAAALGHPIAKQQVDGLLSPIVSSQAAPSTPNST